jgi:hypothetical protein
MDIATIKALPYSVFSGITDQDSLQYAIKQISLPWKDNSAAVTTGEV